MDDCQKRRTTVCYKETKRRLAGTLPTHRIVEAAKGAFQQTAMSEWLRVMRIEDAWQGMPKTFNRHDLNSAFAHCKPSPQCAAQGHHAYAHKRPVVWHVIKNEPTTQHGKNNLCIKVGREHSGRCFGKRFARPQRQKVHSRYNVQSFGRKSLLWGPLTPHRVEQRLGVKATDLLARMFIRVGFEQGNRRGVLKAM